MVNGILVSGIRYWRRNTRAGVKASGRAEITSRALQESTELDVAVSIPFTLVVPYEWHLLPLRVHFWHVHGKYISVKSLIASIATTDYGGPAGPRSFQTQSCFSEACFVNSAQQALHNFCTQKPGTVEVGAHPWYLTINALQHVCTEIQQLSVVRPAKSDGIRGKTSRRCGRAQPL